ncbi:MAG: hypothetical protein WBD24_03520 [Candidatus Omnitrophota bacterium]
MLQKWFNELTSQQRMLVRVVLCFLAALFFWGFYANVAIDGSAIQDNLLYLAASVLFFSAFLYLELGRRKK